MTSVFDQAARVCLQWAAAIMPRARREWIKAMAAELDAMRAGPERARFALGCLSFAVTSWSRSGRGMVWIGRGLLAAGLWSMSAVGAYMAIGLEDVPRFTLLAACCVYSLGGAIALISLRAFRHYGIFGAATAATAWCLLVGVGPIVSRDYFAAIALETAALMTVLLLASTFLTRLNNRDAETSDA